MEFYRFTRLQSESSHSQNAQLVNQACSSSSEMESNLWQWNEVSEIAEELENPGHNNDQDRDVINDITEQLKISDHDDDQNEHVVATVSDNAEL